MEDTTASLISSQDSFKNLGSIAMTNSIFKATDNRFVLSPCVHQPQTSFVKMAHTSSADNARRNMDISHSLNSVIGSSSLVSSDTTPSLSPSLMNSFGDHDGFKLIHKACRYFPQNALIIQMILNLDPLSVKAPVNMNGVNLNNFTPKSDAATETGFSDEDMNGSFPLHILLANGGSYDAVNILLNTDPQILQLKDASGCSPLIVALKYKCSSEVIRLLLSVDDSIIEVPDDERNFPLHTACNYGCCPQVAEWLVLKYPLAVDLRNDDGRTPLELANFSEAFCDAFLTILQEAALR